MNYAFVTFKYLADLRRATRICNGVFLEGSRIKVSAARAETNPQSLLSSPSYGDDLNPAQASPQDIAVRASPKPQQEVLQKIMSASNSTGTSITDGSPTSPPEQDPSSDASRNQQEDQKMYQDLLELLPETPNEPYSMEDVIDLTGLVTKMNETPSFEGIYSFVFQGSSCGLSVGSQKHFDTPIDPISRLRLKFFEPLALLRR